MTHDSNTSVSLSYVWYGVENLTRCQFVLENLPKMNRESNISTKNNQLRKIVIGLALWKAGVQSDTSIILLRGSYHASLACQGDLRWRTFPNVPKMRKFHFLLPT